jgi:hypothetical protein
MINAGSRPRIPATSRHHHQEQRASHVSNSALKRSPFNGAIRRFCAAALRRTAASPGVVRPRVRRRRIQKHPPDLWRRRVDDPSTPIAIPVRFRSWRGRATRDDGRDRDTFDHRTFPRARPERGHEVRVIGRQSLPNSGCTAGALPARGLRRRSQSWVSKDPPGHAAGCTAVRPGAHLGGTSGGRSRSRGCRRCGLRSCRDRGGGSTLPSVTTSVCFRCRTLGIERQGVGIYDKYASITV